MRRRSAPPPRRPGPRPQGPDDAAIDAIVDGGPVDAAHDRLATFARLVRTALLDVPDPPPSPELASLLRGEASSSSASLSSSPSARRRRGGARRVAGLVARVAGLGLVAKIGLGASLAAASVTGAGAAGVLPAPARDAVRDAIESVTPVDFDGGSEAGPAGQPQTTTTVSVASPGSELRLDLGDAADDGPVPPDSTRRDRAGDRHRADERDRAGGRDRADARRAERETQREVERDDRDGPGGRRDRDEEGADG